MVIFGKVPQVNNPTNADLYQLIIPVGWIIFFLGLMALWYFRKNMRAPERHTDQIVREERFYATRPTYISLMALLISGIAILFSAESMVKSIEELSIVTGMPFVIAGVLAGIIGCLGEMLVVHNFSISPKGRIGDAIVGVAMDNIVTIIGASIVAIMGGIFLGGNALILIFVIILCLNTVLLWQIGKLQRTILTMK
jgi:Ca2+/Na+ antiporter